MIDPNRLARLFLDEWHPPTASAVPIGLSGQNESDDDFLSALLSRYGVSN